MPLLGVILCGGQSSRMGSDKGLLQAGDITWAQTAVQKVEALSLPVVLSINQHQHSKYSLLFKESDLIIDHDELSIGGPLKGLLSVHKQFAEHDLLLLACDLPKMQLDVLEELLVQYQEHKSDAIVFKNHDRIEPLCGVYRSAGLNKILAIYQNGKLARHSMLHVLDLLSACFIPLRNEWQSSFKNFNSPDDLV